MFPWLSAWCENRLWTGCEHNVARYLCKRSKCYRIYQKLRERFLFSNIISWFGQLKCYRHSSQWNIVIKMLCWFIWSRICMCEWKIYLFVMKTNGKFRGHCFWTSVFSIFNFLFYCVNPSFPHGSVQTFRIASRMSSHRNASLFCRFGGKILCSFDSTRLQQLTSFKYA